MNPLRFLALVSSILLTSAQVQIPNLQEGLITCVSSFNNQPQQCQAPGRIVEASLENQQFGENCRVYSTFGFVENYLWVRNRCGGTFRIKYVPTQYPNNNLPVCNEGEITLYCSGNDLLCHVPVYIDRVTSRQQVSNIPVNNAACAENYGYGINHNHTVIWTNRGCQGFFDVDFRICTVQSSVGCRSFRATVQCGAVGIAGGYSECSVPVEITSVRTQPFLGRLLPGTSACQENVSYGIAGDRVWRSPACSGPFIARYRVCSPLQSQQQFGLLG